MENTLSPGTKDGRGASDHDIEYAFGHPKYNLTVHQIARLLIVRGRFQDGDYMADAYDGDFYNYNDQ